MVLQVICNHFRVVRTGDGIYGPQGRGWGGGGGGGAKEYLLTGKTPVIAIFC